MSILGFIPARGGSKGIPRKNLVVLGGKPLIQHTIEAARDSSHLDEIFVSSDDAEIIEFCKSLKVEVPYVRPKRLGADDTPMIDVVLDALRWRQDNGFTLPDSIMLLQPTSPLRTSRHIDAAVEQFRREQAESLISVHEMTEHPYECIKLTEKGWGFLQKPEIEVHCRQYFKKTFYYINGAIYLAETAFLERQMRFFCEGQTSLFIMPAEFGVDIDNMRDLRRAEFCLGFSDTGWLHG